MSIRDINKVCYPSTIPSNNMGLKLTFNVKEMSGKLPRQVLEDSYLQSAILSGSSSSVAQRVAEGEDCAMVVLKNCSCMVVVWSLHMTPLLLQARVACNF